MIMPKEPVDRSKPRRKKKNEPPTAVYQMHIMLEDVDPKIWRCVLVSGDATSHELHDIIMVVMVWTDSHLHQFHIRGRTFGDPEQDSGEDEVPYSDENNTVLCQAVGLNLTVFHHEYDFGDDWHHRIEVESSVDKDDRYPGHPLCLAGERSCPPEDCGGTSGYEELLTALADPKHPDHEHMREWAGEDFDPEKFDLAETNARLKMLR